MKNILAWWKDLKVKSSLAIIVLAAMCAVALSALPYSDPRPSVSVLLLLMLTWLTALWVMIMGGLGGFLGLHAVSATRAPIESAQSISGTLQTAMSLEADTSRQQDVKQQRSIELPNDVQTVPQLAMFVDELCEAAGLDMATSMQMNLALEEAVVNVMNYAYPAGTRGSVNIKAEIDDMGLTFVITDQGVPFDPTARDEADVTLSAEERPIGGLGIFLVRSIMDSIAYERINGQNVLTLRKTLHQD